MSTTRPRSRASSAASSTGSLVEPPAARNTASAPWPPVSSASARRPGRAPERSGESAQTRAQRLGQRAALGSEMSTPTTRTPEASSSCTTSWPISPRPMTTAISPSCSSPWRTPCMAIAPTVVKAAWRGSTPSGTGAYRLTGTQLSSACRAYSLPAQATRWPTWYVGDPGAHLDDATAQRVAERRVGVEPVHHLLEGGLRALLRRRSRAPSSPGRAGPAPCRAATAWPPTPSSARCPWRSGSTRCGPAPAGRARRHRERRRRSAHRTCSSERPASRGFLGRACGLMWRFRKRARVAHAQSGGPTPRG